MNRKNLLATGTLLALLAMSGSAAVSAQDYETLHQNAVVVDTHNDVLISVLEGLRLEDDLSGKTHTDLARLKRGGVDVQVFSVWSDGSYGKGRGFAYANRQIDTLYAIAARNPGKMMIATSPEDLAKAVQEQKLAAMIGVEGGHMIENNLDYLEKLYRRGARYLTLTWNNSTSWATSAMDESSGKIPKSKRGLSRFGRQVVAKMNEMGMMVDLSHVGEQTFWDVLEVTTKPVIVSHSCVHQIAPHYRNLTDEQIKAIGRNGGVIHINFFSQFLDKGFERRQDKFNARHKAEMDSLRYQNLSNGAIRKRLAQKYPEEATALRPPLSLLIDHIDHIVQLIGADHVGLGSDFDGITSTPLQLDSVADMPIITRELLNRGYSQEDIEKILGGNFIRIFRENQGSKI